MPSRHALLLCGTLLALAGCDPFAPRGQVKERMAARTAEAPIVALRVDTVTVTDPDDMMEDVRHDVWYSFRTEGGVKEDSLKSTLYIGSEDYKVCYDPRDPDNSTIELADLGCGRVY